MAINTGVTMGAEKTAVFGVAKIATVCSNARSTEIKSRGSLAENRCAVVSVAVTTLSLSA